MTSREQQQQNLLDLFQTLTPSLRNVFLPPQNTTSTTSTTNTHLLNTDTTKENKILLDIVNSEFFLTIYAEIPGVEKRDLNIDFYNNKITISVNKIKNYVSEMSEIKFGTFERTITLPICVTRKDKINTSYINGVLTIQIDKLAEEENKFSLKIN